MALADQLQTDLTTAMKARDELTVAVLRSVIAAVKEARVAGAEARDLSDDDVLAVVAREAKKRDEAATAFADAGRTDQAARERAEGEVLAALPPRRARTTTSWSTWSSGCWPAAASAPARTWARR